jgi:hypothetical protein
MTRAGNSSVPWSVCSIGIGIRTYLYGPREQ